MAKFAPIATSTSGATIVAAVPNKRIRVIGYLLTFADATFVKFQSSAGPTDLTGPLYGLPGPPIPSPYAANGMDGQTLGLFQTKPGEALILYISSNVAIGGHITYAEVN